MTPSTSFVIVFLLLVLAAERVAVEFRTAAVHHDSNRTVSMVVNTSLSGVRL